jgi:hypothetical protein
VADLTVRHHTDRRLIVCTARATGGSSPYVDEPPSEPLLSDRDNLPTSDALLGQAHCTSTANLLTITRVGETR